MEKKREKALVWVLGAGTSGVAAARLLVSHGIAIRVLDDNVERAEAVERELGVVHEEGEAEVAVVSPGLSAEARLRAEAVSRGMELVSELDAALPYLSCRFVGVTGSKGKSSLVKLIADGLCRSGKRAIPCGNYGTALAEVALQEPPAEISVVECSSYQLETTKQLHPEVGIFLNLSPDHLPRHGTMDAYRDAKMRLFQRQDAHDLALLPSSSIGEALQTRYRELGLRGTIATFGNEDTATWRWVPGRVLGPNHLEIDLAGTYFDNGVLGPAAAAAVATFVHFGLEKAQISHTFSAFEPLPHRRELIATINGVRYINDSKATSLTALLAGVSMVDGPIRLIAGGRLKENSLDIAKELMTEGVKKGYLIGECAEKLSTAWSTTLPVQICGTLEAAVATAAAESSPGETVLLSPGTASFDQFRSFEDRGNRFAQLVHDVESGRRNPGA